MAKALTYKKSTSTTLKAVGFIDAENSTIEIEGSVVDIKTLLNDFDGEFAELQIKLKTDEDLDLSSTDENEE